MRIVKVNPYKIFPIPQVNPMAMAIKTIAISRAVPATERNLTKEKEPATAMPAPIDPLTIMITTATTAGSIPVVMAKDFVTICLYCIASVKIIPRINADSILTVNAPRDNTSVEEVEIEFNSVSIMPPCWIVFYMFGHIWRRMFCKFDFLIMNGQATMAWHLCI